MKLSFIMYLFYPASCFFIKVQCTLSVELRYLQNYMYFMLHICELLIYIDWIWIILEHGLGLDNLDTCATALYNII